jgi:glycosyltransferase involved in cell wall biosynthesis
MRIGIDARFWGIEHTGIGRYLMELVLNLEKIDSQNEYVIFLRKKYFFKLKFKNPNFKKALADFPHYSFAEQFLFPGVLSREKLDLVHFPHFNLPIFFSGKFVITVHDLIKHESRGPQTTTRHHFFYYFKYLGYLLVINLALRRTKLILVPSLWWKKKLVRKFNLSSRKVKVTYESVSENFFNFKKALGKEEAKALLKKYQIQTPFVIYTGNLYPHKNMTRLAQAIKRVNQEKKVFLVVACAKSIFWQRFKKEIDSQGIGHRIILAGFVPDKELVALYQLAKAFVFPSLLEGFGLPGLEAMAAGLPVISSKASCLPEIYGEAALYFNPKISKDISEKIILVLKDSRLRKKLIQAGEKRVKGFSWQKMAQETLKIYEKS